MKVCHTLFHKIAPVQNWPQFVQRYPWIAHLLCAQADLGLQPIWVSASDFPTRFGTGSIRLHLVAASRGLANFIAKGSRVLPDQAQRVMAQVSTLRPDVIHHHDLTSLSALAYLSRYAAQRPVRWIVQDHGGAAPTSRWKQAMFKKHLRRVSRVIFADQNVAQAWVRSGLFPGQKLARLFAISSPFKPAGPRQREALRKRMQLCGEPVFGWVANLDANKDPITILKGLRSYFQQHSRARLYMYFRNSHLKTSCLQQVQRDPVLRDRVHLRGERPHPQMESIFQAFDYFIQGSHHEAYGYSVVEAMSTGAIPIVTDIPSFRLATDSGRFGYLFPPGDAAALSKILQRLPPQPDVQLRQEMLDYFDQELSYAALAKKLLTLYLAAQKQVVYS